MTDSYDVLIKKGGWVGTFWTEANQPHEMKIEGYLTLDTQAGYIEGRGEDSFGTFSLRGFISSI